MSALFPRWTNTLARVSLAVVALGAMGGLSGLLIYVRSPLNTDQFHPIDQPIEFDHRHHVADDGIDCRYCHTQVETAANAGIPPTSTCMNCHGQIWNKSPLLDKVRASYFTDAPIPWIRVHWLPDFVYFNHSIHVNKGIGCVTCHGRVDTMAKIMKAQPMNMGWCIDCHRAPEQHLRPRDQITSMTWTPGPDAAALRAKLAREYNVKAKVNCTTCHR